MFGRTKRVYVLGAGPAGLLAAHAGMTLGYDVVVFSKPDLSGKPQKSELYGCQYLHAYIPGVGLMRDGWVPVSYQLNGSVDTYRRKVYGDSYQGSVSPDEYGPEEDHKAWNLRQAYDALWDYWGERIVPMTATPDKVEKALLMNPRTFLINTVPAPAVCRDMENHKFASASIWAMGTTGPHHARLRALPYTAPDNTVVCNGERDTHWYRAATVFGYSTLEWPGGAKPPISGVVPVSKPLSTDCTCWLGKRSIRLGRFGRWEKGVLVHTAYFDAMEALR